MQKIAFIINPISGTRRDKDALPQLILDTVDTSRFTPQVLFTEHAGHGRELAAQLAAEGWDAVVAVGGDGTVNEVATGLCDTGTALGIIPIGSGDGLARHLRIPRDPRAALERLNRAEVTRIDYGVENNHHFFTTCGTGFDAHIADRFATAGKRGLATYLRQIVADYFGYRRQHYRLKGDGIDLETEAFLITFANADQWGNNGFIAPHASLQDGLMDIVIVTRVPALALPVMAVELLTKNIDRDLFVHTLHASEVTLYREKPDVFHCDGDPHDESAEVHIRLVHDGLKMLV